MTTRSSVRSDLEDILDHPHVGFSQGPFGAVELLLALQ